MITLFFLFWYAHVVRLINVFCCYCLFTEISCAIIDSSSKRKHTLLLILTPVYKKKANEGTRNEKNFQGKRKE